MKRAHFVVMAVIAAGATLALMADRNNATPAPAVTLMPTLTAASKPAPGTNRPARKPAQPHFEWASSLRLASMNGRLLSGGSHSQSLTVRHGDTLSALFARAGLPATDWIALLQLDGKVNNMLRTLQPGDTLRYTRTPDGHLAKLEYQFAPLQVLHVERSGQEFSYSVTRKPTTVRIVRVAGTVHKTLLAAARRAGVDYGTAASLGHIFHWRIDLSRTIHPGDHFVLVYQQVYAHDQLIHSGPVLAAELDSGQRTLTAFRYTDNQGNTVYYDSDGKTLRPSILRTPVHYTRVSSHFSRNRLNPVLHVWRPHYGVDLAAPKGTPIHAAANGHVKFVGHDGGYGRLVILDNFGPYSTRYGHMSRFAKGLDEGDYVHQGQVIGYVGESGVATGPHLHFEIRVNGKPKPPLKVDLPGGAPIPNSQKAAYKKVIAPFLTALNSAPATGRTLIAQRQVPATNVGKPLTVAAIDTALEAALINGHDAAAFARRHG